MLRTTEVKVGGNTPKIKKNVFCQRFAFFFGPACGLTHPDGCIRTQAAGENYKIYYFVTLRNAKSRSVEGMYI